jgi:hypothetical protein
MYGRGRAGDLGSLSGSGDRLAWSRLIAYADAIEAVANQLS